MKQRIRVQTRPPMSAAMRTASYWLSGSLLALTTALILEGALHLHLLVGWLIAINLFTFLYYGIDKLNSIWEDKSPKNKAEKVRIPEVALLLLALVGGSPGALLAVLVLNHKTNDGWFVLRLLLALAAQGVALYLLRDKLSLT
jgi:uncharacterized membrane protein YsdA (DUF1294 family)